MKVLILLFFLCIHVINLTKSEEHPQTDQRLLQIDLFKNYDQDISPDQENKTAVRLGILFGNYEYKPETEILDIQCFIRLVWTDNRLTWNSTETGINGFAPEFGIWRPYVTSIRNSGFDEEPLYHSDGIQERNINNLVQSTFVRSDGHVSSVHLIRLTGKCFADLIEWPKDKASCNAYIGSEAIFNLNLTTLKYSNTFLLTNYLEVDNQDWFIKSHNETKLESKAGNNEFGQIINLELVLERCGGIFSSLFFLPGIVLAALTLTLMILNFDNTTRLVVLEISFIIHTYLLQIIAFHVSSSGVQPPHLVKYFYYSILVTGLSIVETVTVKSISSIAPKSQWVLAFLKYLEELKLLDLLIIPQFQKVTRNELEDVKPEDSQGDNHKKIFKDNSWKIMAFFIDRLMLCAIALAYSYNILHFLLF